MQQPIRQKSLKPAQRTSVIVLAFVLTLSLLWQIHATHSQARPHSPQNLEWQQPLSISTLFPQPISELNWQFDYEASEQIVLKIPRTKNGDLILNENTAKLLEEAVSRLPPRLDSTDIKQLERLAAKGLTENTGKQLAKLLTHYYLFSHAWHRLKTAPTHTMDKEALFKEKILLQNKYLGKQSSKQLFGQQNAVTHYLYARKRINENTHLNQSQKQQQLDTLQQRFKANER